MADGWYTHGPDAVYDSRAGSADRIMQNGTGGKAVLVKDGPALVIRDLNGTVLPSDAITSNDDGQSIMFQVQSRHCLVQFGDIVNPSWGVEVAAELDNQAQVLQAAQEAVTAAQAAVADAQAALQAAQAGTGSGGGGLPAGTTLEDIPNGVSRIAMTQAEREKLSTTPTSFLKVGTAATDAKRGDYSPTAKDVGAVVSMSGDVRLWTKRTTAQGPPTEAEGAVRGTDYVFLDVV